MKNLVLSLVIIGMSVLSVSAHAEEIPDKTGTNPINFTHDFRVYNEYLWLNTAGDSSQNITTVEYRMPFADGKWQFRGRVRHTSIDLDLNDDGHHEISEGGMGESDFRFLTVPYLDMSKKMAIAAGIETFLPTAEEGLGSERLSFGPQIFGVFFTPFGITNSLFAPAYQHKFSVYESSDNDFLHQGLIDIFFLKTSEDKVRWAMFNPQIIMDYEEDTEFVNVDLEIGTMVDKWVGSQGHSFYLRPGFQIGSDRPAEGSFEVGYKVVW